MLPFYRKDFYMNNFLGFITLKKENFISEKYINDKKKENTEEFFYHKTNNYSFFLSYTHQDSQQIENDKILILLNGNITNKTFLILLLKIQNSKIKLSELLEKAYQEWGIDLIKKLEGSFSLIIYDKRKELLFLGKDRVGLYPLNFYQDENLIIFGSRVSQFNQVPNFTQAISPQGLGLYMQFGFILQPHTIFKECYKVKSGFYNEFNLQTKVQESKAYWKLEWCYKNKKIISNENKIIENSEQLLQEAIETHDKPKIAVSLSGGYDSATIAGLVQQQNSSKINTITIGFEDTKINEAPEAKAIAKHLNTNHHEYYFTAKDALNIVPKLSTYYDEPFAEYAGSPTILTTQLLKEKGINHLFVGDGGDEVFATAEDVHRFEQIQSIPLGLKKAFTIPLKKINLEHSSYLTDTYNLPTKYSKFLNILSSKDIPEMIKVKNILFREDELQKNIKGYTIPFKTTFDEINFNGYNESVDEIIGTYFKTTMIDGELNKSYGACNQFDIHLHTPFLNKNLIDYMATVPSSIKIKNGIKKYILKEIAHKYIPKELLDRPKSGFSIPFASWMKNELKALVYAQINEKRLNEDNIFYTSEIINIRNKFYEGNDAYKFKLWRVFLFQLWYEKFKG